MTTTDMQHTTSESTADTDPTVADTPSQADDGASMLAKARYDAFRTVTEARQEAETILDEARTEAADLIREAEMTAESIRDAARLQADDDRATTGAPILSEQTASTAEEVADLHEEHQHLTDRVSSLRMLADQLEERFAALAKQAQGEPADRGHIESDTADTPARSTDPSTAPVLDYAPSVPAPAPAADASMDESGDDAPQAPAERGSFYSRRSAKLPRIGDAGGKSALDMMKSIRESFDDKAG